MVPLKYIEVYIHILCSVRFVELKLGVFQAAQGISQ